MIVIVEYTATLNEDVELIVKNAPAVMMHEPEPTTILQIVALPLVVAVVPLEVDCFKYPSWYWDGIAEYVVGRDSGVVNSSVRVKFSELSKVNTDEPVLSRPTKMLVNADLFLILTVR